MDNEPKVFYTPEVSNTQNQSRFKPKYLLYVFIAVVVAEVVWGIQTLLAPVPVQKSEEPVQAAGPSLSLTASSEDIKPGENFSVTVGLQTEGRKTAGTDIVLKFDPRFLEASTSGFVRGDIYSDYPPVSIDNKAGVIKASGIISLDGKGFEGPGLFGSFPFKAKMAGQTVIQLDYIKDSYADSNIVEFGTNTDILERVGNLEINIK